MNDNIRNELNNIFKDIENITLDKKDIEMVEQDVKRYTQLKDIFSEYKKAQMIYIDIKMKMWQTLYAKYKLDPSIVYSYNIYSKKLEIPEPTMETEDDLE